MNIFFILDDRSALKKHQYTDVYKRIPIILHQEMFYGIILMVISVKNIFEVGDFSNYKKYDLSKSRGSIELRHSYYGIGKPAVFISHKHDELDELSDIIGFLEYEYNVNCYIDSRDPTLPKTTSGETAKRIKERIEGCNKFILLATEGAISSMWCNWELGYGDAQKSSNNIAIFPIKRKGTLDSLYAGNEYLETYPYIVKRHNGDKYSDGSPIHPGYYVREYDGKSFTITDLEAWFKK